MGCADVVMLAMITPVVPCRNMIWEERVKLQGLGACPLVRQVCMTLDQVSHLSKFRFSQL